MSTFGDFSIVLVIAGVGVAVVYFLFNSVANVPAAKAVKDATASPKPKAAPKGPSKKEIEEKKRKEKEIDDLIAREAVSTKGMHATRLEVESLEAHRAATAKKKAGKGKDVEAEAKTSFTEAEKTKERAQGFKVIVPKAESKPIVAKPASPTSSSASPSGSPTTGRAPAPALSKREEMEKKLSQFFKSNGKKKRDADYEVKPADADADKKKDIAGKVVVRKAIAASEANTWNADREW